MARAFPPEWRQSLDELRELSPEAREERIAKLREPQRELIRQFLPEILVSFRLMWRWPARGKE